MSASVGLYNNNYEMEKSIHIFVKFLFYVKLGLFFDSLVCECNRFYFFLRKCEVVIYTLVSRPTSFICTMILLFDGSLEVFEFVVYL